MSHENDAKTTTQETSLDIKPVEVISGQSIPASSYAALPTDADRFMRLGVWMLLIGFGGFLAWAVSAPLDEGVPASAVAQVESKRKEVAHLTGGIVQAIHVRGADFVNEGDPLVTLDNTTISAQFLSALKEWVALKANLSRLQAERLGEAVITFPPEIFETEPEAGGPAQMEAQRELFKARRAALAGATRILEQSAETHENDARAKSVQLRLSTQQLDGTRTLAEEGYVSQNQRLDLELTVLDLENRIELARRQAEDARLKLAQRQYNYQQEVETEYANTESRLSVAEEQIRSLRKDLARTVIRSPVSGHVNALAVHTIGGVVKGGAPLMEIVPNNEQLVFMAHIETHLVDRVHSGLDAEIQLQNFAQQPQLVIAGRVLDISPDLIEDPTGRMPPHFNARVAVTPEGVATLRELRLQPGMPATVLIKTGERTLLDYLMRPLLQRLHTALKEA